MIIIPWCFWSSQKSIACFPASISTVSSILNSPSIDLSYSCTVWSLVFSVLLACWAFYSDSFRTFITHSLLKVVIVDLQLSQFLLFLSIFQKALLEGPESHPIPSTVVLESGVEEGACFCFCDFILTKHFIICNMSSITNGPSRVALGLLLTSKMRQRIAGCLRSLVRISWVLPWLVVRICRNSCWRTAKRRIFGSAAQGFRVLQVKTRMLWDLRQLLLRLVQS